MNTNCLEGMRCPICGQEREILVRVSMWVSLKDEGTDAYAESTKEVGDVEYDDESDASCPICGFAGKFKDLKQDELPNSHAG